MKEIQLTKDKVALVDDADFEWLSQWAWYPNTNGYAARNHLREDARETQSQVFMHREIVGTPKGMYTDHIDGNKLNNTRGNLRICSKNENGYNRGRLANNQSGYKGVHQQSKNAWVAQIRVQGKQIYLGSFNEAVKAARAYNKAAIKYHGEFAYLNKIKKRPKGGRG